MEFKINNEKQIVPPKGFIEISPQENNSKAELLELLNTALDRFEEKDTILYCEATGVQEASVENGNKNIEVVENDTEIVVSVYTLEKQWIKKKEESE